MGEKSNFEGESIAPTETKQIKNKDSKCRLR